MDQDVERMLCDSFAVKCEFCDFRLPKRPTRMAYAELSQAIILRHCLKCAPCGEAHPEKLQQLLLLRRSLRWNIHEIHPRSGMLMKVRTHVDIRNERARERLRTRLNNYRTLLKPDVEATLQDAINSDIAVAVKAAGPKPDRKAKKALERRKAAISAEYEKIISEVITLLLDDINKIWRLEEHPEEKRKVLNLFDINRPASYGFVSPKGAIRCAGFDGNGCRKGHGKIYPAFFEADFELLEPHQIDHIITRKEIARSMVEFGKIVHRSGGSLEFNPVYYFRLLFNQMNFRLVHKDCHDRTHDSKRVVYEEAVVPRDPPLSGSFQRMRI